MAIQGNAKTDLEKLVAEHWSHAVCPQTQERWNRRLRMKVMLWRGSLRCSMLLKRTVDVIGSAGALVVFFPVLAVVAVLIKFEDGGPIFFRQNRVGKDGKIFKMFKIRSMHLNAEARKVQLSRHNQHVRSTTFKMKNDPRITRLGRWIRQYSVDEVPQFWNVLKGDMTLVGPRPAVHGEVIEYRARELRRLVVKPGITGLWQIGGRGDIDFEGQVRLDLEYIRSEGFWANLRILLLTVPAVLLGRGAY